MQFEKNIFLIFLDRRRPTKILNVVTWGVLNVVERWGIEYDGHGWY